MANYLEVRSPLQLIGSGQSHCRVQLICKFLDVYYCNKAAIIRCPVRLTGYSQSLGVANMRVQLIRKVLWQFNNCITGVYEVGETGGRLFAEATCI